MARNLRLIPAAVTAMILVPWEEGVLEFGPAARSEMDAPGRGGLLCVANYSAGTGFAWSFIERIWAALADRLRSRKMQTWVAYPEIESVPSELSESPARVARLPVRLNHPILVWELLRFVREHEIRIMYLSDRPVWHPAYCLLHAFGVERIVVHDHTSGHRTRPSGLKRLLKRVTRKIPGSTADSVIAVSDFVARRKVEVDLVPSSRVERVWNFIRIPPEEELSDDDRKVLHDRLDLPRGRPVIACACRAAPEKGVQHLLRAFDSLIEKEPKPRPVLLYMGDGPAAERLRGIVGSLASREDIVFTGYREDADVLLGAATVAVVPSTWKEAFGLAALEPMSRGVPVVASRVGGLKEVVADGETGILVSPGDEEELEAALASLLEDSDRRARLGRQARRRATQRFRWDDQMDKIERILVNGRSR